MPNFFRNTTVIAATIVLLMQAAAIRTADRPESIPPSMPLAGVPRTLGSWQFASEGVIDQETLDVLRADDILNRVYSRGYGLPAYLFVAAFRSQRNGKAPHSPKNCLPGSGWLPLDSGEITIDSGQGPITVNRYVVAHGDERSVVLYWYQSRNRAVASEYKAKFWVMADAVRLNRTDTALVRVVVPVVNRDEEAATKTAADFVKSFYGTLLHYLPA